MSHLIIGRVFLVCVVPEMSKTWDRDRPPTTLEHIIADSKDGGEGTRLMAHVEHAKYVHPILTGCHIPDDEIEVNARQTLNAGMDIHGHAWRADDFRQMLDYFAPALGFKVVVQIFAVNENAFVLQKI